MAVNVEVLEKLERKIVLNVPVSTIEQEVQARLKRLARSVKMDGFRPGKVPLSVVAQRYGGSVQYEVLNDKVSEAFNQAANEAQLRVAGQPRITEKEGAAEGFIDFEAVFEVFPDVKIEGLGDLEIERVNVEVDEAAIERTLDILRKQRRTLRSAARTMPCRTAIASPSTSRAKSMATHSPAARPKALPSWWAKARCSRSSRTPCAA